MKPPKKFIRISAPPTSKCHGLLQSDQLHEKYVERNAINYHNLKNWYIFTFTSSHLKLAYLIELALYHQVLLVFFLVAIHLFEWPEKITLFFNFLSNFLHISFNSLLLIVRRLLGFVAPAFLSFESAALENCPHLARNQLGCQCLSHICICRWVRLVKKQRGQWKWVILKNPLQW